MSTVLQEIDVLILNPKSIDPVKVLIGVLAAPVSSHAGEVFVRCELVGTIGSECDTSGRLTRVAISCVPANALTKAEP